MKNKLLTLLSGLLVIGLLAACSTPASPLAAAAAPVRTLAANGTGEVYITPDIAYINVGIHSEADDVSAALSDNNTQAQNISDTLTALGVDKKDIQTSSFNVYPMSTYAPDGTVSRKYFAVDNTVNVTVRDLSALGKLLDAVVKSGANTINGISFDIMDKEAATAQARDLAIANAKTEAASIAKAAGVSLGDLQAISVSSSDASAPMYSAKAVGGGGSVPVSAGQLLISVYANLTYAIK